MEEHGVTVPQALLDFYAGLEEVGRDYPVRLSWSGEPAPDLPLLGGMRVEVPPEAFLELFDRYVEYFRGSEAEVCPNLLSRIKKGVHEAGSQLVERVFSNDLEYVEDFIWEQKFSPGLFRLLLAQVMRPFLRELGEREGERRSEWERDSCPICGCSPGLAVLQGERSLLSCSLCGHLWEVRPGRCPSCGEALEAVHQAEGFTVLACSGCRRYLKATAQADQDLFLAEVRSLPLDVWAEQAGYLRPGAEVPAAAGS